MTGSPDRHRRATTWMRQVSVVVTGLLVVAASSVAAGVPAGASPPSGPPAAYVQTQKCVDQVAPPTTVANGVSWAQQALQYTAAWQFSQGAGVRVAVIDTGVNPGAEFGARLKGVADLVAPRLAARPGGLDDCDGHGTLVAGIIAASPDPKSGFTGVAPGVTLLSIRQSSERFGVNAGDTSATNVAGTPESLATAINDAVAAGAQVINVSEAACGPAGSTDNDDLDAAVAHAVAANVVVVAAAGNLSSSGNCSQQNTPGQAPVTAATPADLAHPTEQSGVLTVAAINQDGTPASFSLAGAWVSVAAPGTQVISSNPTGGSGQVNQLVTDNGTGPIQGTSFAAPYVTGVVALVRARFPELSAADVVARIEATAAHPAAPGGRNDYVGYGMVDPVAALTTVLPSQAPPAAASLPPLPHKAASGTTERSGLGGSIAVAAVLIVLAVAVQTRRVRRLNMRPRR